MESDVSLYHNGQTTSKLSIHALRMESDYNFGEPILYLSLSIHALRMESDSPPIESTFPRKLSIHALRMESDDAASVSAAPTDTFYPRSPHGERLLSTYLQIINS